MLRRLLGLAMSKNAPAPKWFLVPADRINGSTDVWFAGNRGGASRKNQPPPRPICRKLRELRPEPRALPRARARIAHFVRSRDVTSERTQKLAAVNYWNELIGL